MITMWSPFTAVEAPGRLTQVETSCLLGPPALDRLGVNDVNERALLVGSLDDPMDVGRVVPGHLWACQVLAPQCTQVSQMAHAMTDFRDVARHRSALEKHIGWRWSLLAIDQDARTTWFEPTATVKRASSFSVEDTSR